MSDNRTKEQDFLGSPYKEEYDSPQYEEFLTRIFNYGNVNSKTFEIFNNFSVSLRLLSTAELIEVYRAVDEEGSIISKDFIFKIEILARAIVNINGNKLRFTSENTKEWQEFRNTKDVPCDIEQQRFIIRHRFKLPLINLIYEKYSELQKELDDTFTNLKKK